MTLHSDKPINTAILGLGRAGWHLHLLPMLNHGGFNIVAATDPIPERVEEMHRLTGGRVCASVDEILECDDVELVVVATPSDQHYENARQVLESGRHCILEKPMSLSYDDAAYLVPLASEQRKHLFVHHTLLHRAEYHHLKGVVESGVLGPLFHLRAYWGSYARRDDWQTLRRLGGGQLNNTCPHVLSVVLPLLGSPVEDVFADLRNIKDAGDAEDHAHLILRAENGVTADLTVSTAMAAPCPKWMLFGKHGALWSDGETSNLRVLNPASVPDLEVREGAARDRKYLQETLPWNESQLPVAESSVPSFHENVFDSVRGVATPIVTPESALEVVRVTELAARSGARHSTNAHPGPLGLRSLQPLGV